MQSMVRRISFDPVPVLIGLAQGLAIHLLRKQAGEGAAVDGLLCFLFVGPTALILVLGRERRLSEFVVAGALGLLSGLLAFRLSADLGMGPLFASPIAFPFALCLFAAAVIALAFHNSRCETDRGPLPDARLFHHGIDLVLTIVLAWLFCGAVWLVLFLWGALFKLIGITWFADLFGYGWFGWSFSGAAFAAGVVVLRDLPRVVLSVRDLMLTLFRLLGFILALAGILFLCALPFTGLQPLWDTRHASAILLWVMLAMILFANAYVDGTEETKGTKGAKKTLAIPVAVMLVLLPVYGLIALYSLWLRIAQYGFTPDRVHALLLIAVGLLLATAYAVAVITRRRAWPRVVARVNPALAAIVAVLALAAHLPPLEAHRLSAWNQADRLRDGAVAAADMDLFYMKFRLGRPGREALDSLRDDPALMALPDMAAVFAEVDSADQERDWWARRRATPPARLAAELAELRDQVELYPAGQTLPDDFLPTIQATEPGMAMSCRERDPEAPRCTVFRYDFDGDGVADIGFWDGYAGVTVYVQSDDKPHWRIVRLLAATQPLPWKDARKAVAEGNITTAPPLTDDLIIGGVRFD